MAFFSQDLYSTLPVLMRLMVTASFVTGLILNLSKCVIVFYRSNINREEELRKFLDKGLRVRTFAIQNWGKYLGVTLGDGGVERSWSGPISKYVERCRFIRSLSGGLHFSIISYNSIAVSVLLFIASFFELPKAATDAERDGLQILTACPRYAIPNTVLHRFKDIFSKSCNARSLWHEGRAALYRNAARSPSFWACKLEVEEVLEGDDLILGWRYNRFFKLSPLKQMIDMYNFVWSLPLSVRVRPWEQGVLECPKLQKELKKTFFDIFPFESLQEKIGARLRYWDPLVERGPDHAGHHSPVHVGPQIPLLHRAQSSSMYL